MFQIQEPKSSRKINSSIRFGVRVDSVRCESNRFPPLATALFLCTAVLQAHKEEGSGGLGRTTDPAFRGSLVRLPWRCGGGWIMTLLQGGRVDNDGEICVHKSGG
ncbi:unnamed protein product [Linum trigynum]|uniref:Uncharacterized protein n=1 Tax=Linum trigynum TaxID=586398 RepID=A0AAV2GIG8_9ROSI